MATRASQLADEAEQLVRYIKTGNLRDEEQAMHTITETSLTPIELMFLVAKICDLLDPGERADFIAMIRIRGDLKRAV